MEMNNDWVKDPHVFNVNRLKGHSDFAYYRSLQELDNRKSSYTLSLNGYWKFHYAVGFQQLIPHFYDVDYDSDNWDEIKVPGHIQLQGYGKPMYVNQIYPWSGSEQILPGEIPTKNPIGSYITYFDSSSLDKDCDIHITFKGVESAMALWINGQFVGYSEDSFTPSTFDITPYLVEGKNKVAVNVYRFSSGSWLEDQDFWRFSGIFRDVELSMIPRAHLHDIKIETVLNDTYDHANIHVHAYVDSRIDNVKVTYTLLHNQVILHQCTSEKLTPSLSFDIDHPLLWSAEKPNLYELRVYVKDDEHLIECSSHMFGIRELKMIDGVMCINGKRLIFHGVNRHEFSPYTGRVCSYELTKQDILNMKANNINALRTSHYPNQSFVYDLCDQYGLYVIDETNLETHGTWSEFFDKEHILPDDKPEWLDIVLDRAESMYERDKNHASIIMWSLGNESHGGKNIYEMSRLLKEKDQSRFIHYEGIARDRRYNDSSDVESQMYTFVTDIEDYLNEHQDKPFILCEYAHAMGNSNGALYQYIELEKKYHLYQGGFIWDYIDQALYQDGKLCYGGDFEDRPSDYDFCGNGLVFADRTNTPKMQEVKHCYQYVDFTIDNEHVTFDNRYLFTNLNEFVCEAQLLCEGHVIKTKTMTVDCEPLSQVTMEQPFKIYGHNYEYTVIISLKDKDHIVASEQCIFKDDVKKEVHQQLPVTITEDFLNIGVVGKDFQVIFSKQKGLVSYQYHQKEYIRVPVKPHFFRAATNNDVENLYGHRYGEWLLASLYPKCEFVSVKKNDMSCIIEYAYTLPTLKGDQVHMIYEVYGDGEIVIDMSYQPVENEIEMPTFGLMFQFYKDMDHVSYYGYGPEENYIDRCKGSFLGRYEYDVKDNVTPYLYPQECGNRIEVRECVIEGLKRKLLIKGDCFEFSALPYTPFELENARHHDELPNAYQTVVCVHEKQMGVAGDNTWGARTHDEFLLSRHEKHHLRLSLKGL